MLKILKLILILCLLFALFVLGSQNPQQTTINFLVASAELPLAYILSISCAIGVLIGTGISFYVVSVTKIQNLRLKKQNQKLTTEHLG